MKNNIPSQDYPSSIVMKPNMESIEMIKTKDFLSESLMPSKGIEGTIIIGSATSATEPELRELLLNIQPLGWIYISGGKKDENK